MHLHHTRLEHCQLSSPRKLTMNRRTSPARPSALDSNCWRAVECREARDACVKCTNTSQSKL